MKQKSYHFYEMFGQLLGAASNANFAEMTFPFNMFKWRCSKRVAQKGLTGRSFLACIYSVVGRTHFDQ